MRKHLLILSAATLGLMGTAALAQNAAGPMAGKTLTRAEAEAKAGERFAMADVNKDGKLDKADREARQAEHFKKLDTDGNGSISQAEFMAAHQGGKHAGGMGRGGDHAGMKHEGMADDGKMGGMKHRMAGRGGKMGGHMMMRMADADKDGAVTRAEFVSASLKRFDMTDANKDGSVSPDERKAAMQKMREHMKEMRGKMGKQPA
ncbi:EF-hand domain-containing protein [Novosphingobium sp. MW5]|nr:EF-hand domain-containing protein [Novosphingobium sp. MW5]